MTSSPALQNCLSNHYQNVNRKVRRDTSKWKAYFSSFMDLSCHVRHKVTHVLSRRFLCTHTRYILVSFWPRCDSVRHCIPYIIFYIFNVKDLYRDISLMQKRDWLSIHFPFDEVIDFYGRKGIWTIFITWCWLAFRWLNFPNPIAQLINFKISWLHLCSLQAKRQTSIGFAGVVGYVHRPNTMWRITYTLLSDLRLNINADYHYYTR